MFIRGQVIAPFILGVVSLLINTMNRSILYKILFVLAYLMSFILSLIGLMGCNLYEIPAVLHTTYCSYCSSHCNMDWNKKEKLTLKENLNNV